MVCNLDQGQARVLHVVGTKTAVVRATVSHRCVEALRQLRLLDVHFATIPVVFRVVCDVNPLRSMRGAPLLEKNVVLLDEDLCLDYALAPSAEAAGRVIEDIGAGLAAQQTSPLSAVLRGRLTVCK